MPVLSAEFELIDIRGDTQTPQRNHGKKLNLRKHHVEEPERPDKHPGKPEHEDTKPRKHRHLDDDETEGLE